MCETKSTGVMPGFLIGRAQKAAQPCQCHQPAPRRTATQRAQTVLAGVGVVVAMAAANFLEHALQAIGQRPARPRGLGHPGGPPHLQGLTRPRGDQRDSRAP